MDTVTVTIGRNVGTEPLQAEDWNLFVADARRAVEDVADELWVVVPYAGEWAGVREDAVVFHASIAPDGLGLDWLRTRLANLATYYRQESVGLAVGQGELVWAWAPADAPVAA